VTSVKGRIISLWKSMSLPYPEPGIRLIRQDQIETFDARMQALKQELDEAVEQLDRHYEHLKSAARNRLGRLYNPADYPGSLRGLFSVTHDFPSVEPPDYLQQLSPGLYQQECERVAARFDEAVRLAEQAFVEELHGLVAHLTERLTGQTDGQPKVFRDSAVNNLAEFFQRFRTLNVRSNEQLDELVAQCQGVIRGVEPQTLRDDQNLRQTVAQQMASVQNTLDDLLVDRPRRNILRRPR
jgi:DNA anti-recombination protein RmuC